MYCKNVKSYGGERCEKNVNKERLKEECTTSVYCKQKGDVFICIIYCILYYGGTLPCTKIYLTKPILKNLKNSIIY